MKHFSVVSNDFEYGPPRPQPHRANGHTHLDDGVLQRREEA
jgi:hypothetical protein